MNDFLLQILFPLIVLTSENWFLFHKMCQRLPKSFKYVNENMDLMIQYKDMKLNDK